MREILLHSQYGGIMLVVGILLALVAASLSLFSDAPFRHIGWLTILIFGGSFLGLFAVLEIQDIELPRWMQVGRGHGKYGDILLVLWALVSWKLADWLYYRHLS